MQAAGFAVAGQQGSTRKSKSAIALTGVWRIMDFW